jgi:phosphate transport system permease protein
VPAVKFKLRRATREYIIKGFLLLCALSSLVFLAGIVFVLFSQGLRVFGFVRITDLLFGRNWYPTHEFPEFGILPMIYGSVVITFGALILAAPLGIASALFISEVAPSRLKEIIKPVVELLGGIPSVVYGLFGAMVVAPFVQKLFNLPTGLTALSAAIVLGIMILPTITSIVEDAFSAIPKEYREAALALGATKWETMTKIVLPAASSGIATGIILGMGRAIGETMAVLMVAGGSARIDLSLLKPVRAMTSTIAAEMAETVKGSDHFYSLFAIAVVLFIITFIFNLVAGRVTARFQRRFTGGK